MNAVLVLGWDEQPLGHGRAFRWCCQFNCTLSAAWVPEALLEIGAWVIFSEVFKLLKIPGVARVDFQEALNCLCPMGTSESLVRRHS